MDPVNFTGDEVLNMAVRIEENGYRFYTDAAKATNSKPLKDLFLSLAEDEKDHAATFAALRKTLPEKQASGFDPYGEEAQLYLSALADTEIFSSPDKGKKLGAAIAEPKEAINYAIGKEKDSILFYYEILKMVREKDIPLLEKLIDQEKDHLMKLVKIHKIL
ncbi:MAG: ferritin family protein [Nitrospirota bacterium]|nr:ferritin family protein [Nitrospirota bacterium]